MEVVSCKIQMHKKIDLLAMQLEFSHFKNPFNLPQECIAEERERHTAADKFTFSIWDDPKSFSRSGQNIPRRTIIISSSTRPDVTDVAKWWNSALIL